MQLQFKKSISMSGNDIVKSCRNLCLNGRDTTLGNSIHFIISKYNVYKQRLCSQIINARATFTSKCKMSERDKQTASFIRDVLKSDTSFFLMLVYRLRRWPSIKSAFHQRLAYGGLSLSVILICGNKVGTRKLEHDAKSYRHEVTGNQCRE